MTRLARVIDEVDCIFNDDWRTPFDSSVVKLLSMRSELWEKVAY